MRRSTLILVFVVAACLVLSAIAPALGAGFEVAERSGRQMGNAYAGKAAQADDASTVEFNPAGMTRLPGLQAVAALELLVPGGRFANEGSVNLARQTVLGGDSGGNPGDPTWLPNLFLSYGVNDKLSVGLCAYAPFGLKTEYDDGWVGRYHALKSELVVMSVNPCVAYRVLENLSVGAGVSYSMAEAELSNAVDFGSIVAGSGFYKPQQLAALGIAPEANDGDAVINSDVDGAWGYNLGVLYEITKRTRVGLTFRSKIFHELKGDATFDVPANVVASGFPAGSGLFADTGATARITLPEQLCLSAYHDVDEQWAVLADVTWTRWSRFHELRVTYDNPAQPDTAHLEDWDDTFRFSLGTIYRPDPQWSLRAGVAYDQSPISDAHRTPRIPTNDRIWVTFGLGYQVNEKVAVDLTFMHVFIDDAKIDQVSATGQRLVGEFHPFANVFGFQLTAQF